MTETKTEAPEFQAVNKITLAGRLTADPELKYTPSGKAVCRLRLAVNASKQALFIDVVAWEDVAEAAAQSLKKASPVTVEGRLQSRTWEKDGSKRTAIEVVASTVTPAS